MGIKERLRRAGGDIAAIGFISLAPILFLARVLLPWMPGSQTLATGDFIEVYYLQRLGAFREWTAGRVPLWASWRYAGHPLLADLQTAALYPLSWLTFLLFPGYPPSALEWEVALHYALAGLGTFFLARRLGYSTWGSNMAAFAFAFGGYLTGFPSCQLPILETITWLPWLCWAADSLARRPNFRSVAVTATVTALAALAGNPQTFFYTVLGALSWGIYRGRRSRLRTSALLAATALGSGLAGAQLAPTAELILHSQRARLLPYGELSRGLALWEIEGILLPHVGGNQGLYMGIITLALAAVGLFSDHRIGHFWLGMALCALLLAFGGQTALYDMVSLLVPAFALFRNQERIIGLWSLAIALLAGQGADVLREPPSGKWWGTLLRGVAAVAGILLLLALALSAFQAWLPNGEESIAWKEGLSFAGLMAALTALWLGWRARGGHPLRVWQGAALLLLAVDLWTVGMRYSPRAPRPVEFFPRWPLLDSICSDATGPWRISSEGLLPGNGNAAVIYGLEDVTGNSPLQLREYADFLQRIPEWRWWQFLNVRYVLTRRDIAHPSLTRLGCHDGICLYRFEAAVPRAYMVYRLKVAESEDQERLWLSAVELDPLEAAIVRAPSPVVLPPGGPLGYPVTWVERQPNRLAFEAHAAADGILVISQAFYPGWRATVDGRPSPLFRVNGILQGVAVPAGGHRVVIWYDPFSWRLGVLISAVSLALLMGLSIKGDR